MLLNQEGLNLKYIESLYRKKISYSSKDYKEDKRDQTKKKKS